MSLTNRQHSFQVEADSPPTTQLENLVHLAEALAAFGVLFSFWSLVWVVLTIVVTVIAVEKGRSGVGYFLLSLFFSPLVGVLILIAAPDRARHAREAAQHQRDVAELHERIEGLAKRLDDLRWYARASAPTQQNGNAVSGGVTPLGSAVGAKPTTEGPPHGA